MAKNSRNRRHLLTDYKYWKSMWEGIFKAWIKQTSLLSKLFPSFKYSQYQIGQTKVYIDSQDTKSLEAHLKKLHIAYNRMLEEEFYELNPNAKQTASLEEAKQLQTDYKRGTIVPENIEEIISTVANENSNSLDIETLIMSKIQLLSPKQQFFMKELLEVQKCHGYNEGFEIFAEIQGIKISSIKRKYNRYIDIMREKSS